jgi:predicted DNA-binding protein
MTTTTIRIPQQTHQRLRDLAEKRGRTIGEVVDEATRKLEDDDFWQEVNAAYARLRADPIASAEYDAEVALFEGTLLDGLEELPYEGVEELMARLDAEQAGQPRR